MMTILTDERVSVPPCPQGPHCNVFITMVNGAGAVCRHVFFFLPHANQRMELGDLGVLLLWVRPWVCGSGGGGVVPRHEGEYSLHLLLYFDYGLLVVHVFNGGLWPHWLDIKTSGSLF